MNSLRPQATLDLIRLFEASSGVLAGMDGQRLRGIPAWCLPRLAGQHDAELNAWLNIVGYAGVYESVFDDEPVAVELEEDDDPDFMRYRCPETLRWRRVALDETAVHQVNTHAFLNGAADLLDIPTAQRGGIQKAIIEEVLWKLGDVRLDAGIHVPIYVARSLNRNLDDIVGAMASGNSPAILLSCTNNLPDLIRWPEGVVVIPLADVMVTHLEESRIDKARLYKLMAGGQARDQQTSDCPVEYDAFRKVLSIKGKPDWHITGDKQAKVVEYMYQQALNGRWELQANEILTATKIKTSSSGSVRMQSLFKGSLEWEDYIANPSRGRYSFNLG